MIERPTVFGAIAAFAFVAVLLGSALHSHRVLVAGLPEPVRCLDYSDAMQKAIVAAVDHGGMVTPILGTGSMAPWIPASAAGLDPWHTTVAVALTRKGATFDDITPGAPCIYRYKNGTALHGAAKKTGAGWIMSGLHNERSDIWVTRETFVGIVAQVFVWLQQEASR